MMELSNCPNCDALFVRNQFRDVCDACYKEEEKAFETVYQFIRKRENRTATIDHVVEGTGVDEGLIIKFVRKGRLRTSQFPNLGVPCEKCGNISRDGRLCNSCSGDLQTELKKVENIQKIRQEEKEKKATYFARH
ncbi:TIGR03826 family flagellar region protein [Peribacillus sp. SCS-155]|uniref:TIGR03826 family flagellar region protein n=1 Tax=Peribacillus sedimenti TaxID=3115297 RepID=UPI003906BC31